MIKTSLSQRNNAVIVQYENTSDNYLAVLGFGTVFDASDTDCLNVKDKDGKAATYFGPRYKYDHSSKESGITLKPKQKGEKIINIPALYGVENGKYTCTLKDKSVSFAVINPASAAIEKEIDVDTRPKAVSIEIDTVDPVWQKRTLSFDPPPLSELGDAEIISTVTPPSDLEMIPANQPCDNIPLCHPLVTKGRAIATAFCWRSGAVGPGGAISHPVVSQSFSYTRKMKISRLTTAISRLFIWNGGRYLYNPTLYRRWFGATNPHRLEQFKKTFFLSRPFYCKRCFFSAGYYGPGVDRRTVAAAFIHPGSDNFGLILYPLFWSWPDWGADSKITTLVHEYSHGQGGTNLNFLPEVYGRRDCLELARKKPDKAIQNADNYGYYFYEAVGSIHFPTIRPYPRVSY